MVMEASRSCLRLSVWQPIGLFRESVGFVKRENRDMIWFFKLMPESIYGKKQDAF
jgi:hypothetical protein